MSTRGKRWLAVIGPGVLVAATGVGAGDLATGAFVGSKLGTAVLWAVVLGAGMKFVLNEGLARWQLATGSTLLEGAATHLGRGVQWLFLGYLLVWSFFVGSALMNACGVTAHAICPISHARTDKILYGVLHSAVALVLIRRGGYQLFERVMRVCIAVMFVVVLVTAARAVTAWPSVVRGLVWPTIPKFHQQGLEWTVALIGGVGGTVTVLCYGYWIREEGRQGVEELNTSRLDLAFGYVMTGLFGIAMVIIGGMVQVRGGGATLLVDLAEQLDRTMGSVGKWTFLVGAWGAVFSSLLGVWQSVPYLFADLVGLMTRPEATSSPCLSQGGKVPSEGANNSTAISRRIMGTQAVGARKLDTRGVPYQVYLVALAVIPAVGLGFSFENAQKWYALLGALFIPMLALVLLILNGQSRWVGKEHRNSPITSLLLIACLAFFMLVFWLKFHSVLATLGLSGK